MVLPYATHNGYAVWAYTVKYTVQDTSIIIFNVVIDVDMPRTCHSHIPYGTRRRSDEVDSIQWFVFIFVNDYITKAASSFVRCDL